MFDSIRLRLWPFFLVLFCLSRLCFAACPTGDLTGDCVVALDDLAAFADQWLDGGGSANLDGVGGITLGDLALLARDWRTRGLTLVINEFMTNNNGFVVDNAGDSDDWIEIHNYGDQPIDIGGLYLTDNLDDPGQWQVPTNLPQTTTIPAGGYLLIWADNEATEGPLHAGFRLAAGGGEDVGLFDTNWQPIDAVNNFAAQDEDHSCGRYPDAGTEWRVFGETTHTTATPGRSNRQTGGQDNVMINEIMYHPYNADHPLSEDIREEYIELFNGGDFAVDVSGWRITGGIEFEFPAGAAVGPHGFLVVAADTATFEATYGGTSNVVGGWTGRLSNKGDRLRLLSAEGRIIDDVTYSDEGDWGQRRLAPVDAYGHRGWIWSDEHDGLGKSLEVISTAMPNEYGQNWAASLTDKGTPGAPNTATGAETETRLLVNTGATWKYEDHGRTDIGDPATGTAWFGHPDHDDFGWAEGPSQLGYGDQDENWLVGYGPSATNKYITTYFRHAFAVADVSEYLSLKLRLLRDDGAVVYLNGEKVAQSNMDYQTFDYSTRASRAVTGAEEDTFVDFPVAVDKLRQGRNVLAVEIHQESPTSADISFDLILEATVRPDQTPAANDIAPMILDVSHRPTIPHSDEAVTVTARLADVTAAGLTATLCHRIDRSTYSKYVYPTYNAADYTRVPMADDGMNGDGAPGDGVYGAAIPARQNGAVVEFFVEARDAAGNVRTWPAASTIDGKLEQVTNCLYQVDNSFDPAGGLTGRRHGTYRVIMTEGERARLAAIGTTSSDRNSNAEMNATFISVDGADVKVRYNASVRNRGHGSRSNRPNNMRISFAHDHPWKNVTAINVNARYPWVQNAGSAVFQSAGLPTASARPVRVLVNGADLSLTGGTSSPMYGAYVHLESIDTDFTETHFPLDAQGNVYKCLRDAGPADFRYFGNDPTTYRLSYFKETNERQDDWTDLFELTRVLSTAPDATYVEDVKRVLDPEQWLRFLALHVLLANNETTLATGYGDDYFMYRGVADPRFILIAYDLDTIFGKGDSPGGATMNIWRAANIPAMNRFMRNPAFLPRYYYHLNDLIETVLSPVQLDRILREALGRYVAPSQIQDMKNFTAQRNAYVLGLIERDFTINVGLNMVNGYYQTDSSAITLTGTADAIATRTVRVNGDLAGWSPLNGTWTTAAGGGTPLLPGINRLVVQTHGDPEGTELLEEGFVDVWYDDGSESTLVGGTITANTTLQAAAGPWRVTGEVVVAPGATVTIEAGTTVFFEPAGGIRVTGDASATGRLMAEGIPYRHIRLTRVPGGSNWKGLRFENPSQIALPAENRLTCVDMEYGDGWGQAISVSYAKVHIDHVSWAGGNSTALEVDHPYIRVTNCLFPSISGTESVHGHSMTPGGYAVFEGNTFGATTGYNDVIGFSACKRPGPIPEFYDNVFLGGGDDGIDLDGADAHIEGNVFSNFHKDFSGSGTCNAIAAGGVSEIMVARNAFHENDHDVLLQEGCYLWGEQNVFTGSTLASISFGEYDRGVSAGKGAYLEGSIFWNNAAVFESYFDPDPIYGPQELTVHRSIIPDALGALGTGNFYADPQFVDATDFHLKRSSPAVGRGANGLDMGAYVPAGASISGGPCGTTHRTTATFTIGGPGIFGYRYRLMDNWAWAGGWSGAFEIATQPQVALSGLANGHTYTLHVIGRNSAGRWQSDDAAATWTWTVDTSHRRLVINEVLAVNRAALEHAGARPDAVELFYDGPQPVNLAGMSITDDPDEPAKHVFAAGTTMNPGSFKILYCDPNAMGPEYVAFALDGDGDGVYLFDTPANGRALVDSVAFGPQAADLSVGRLSDGTWRLTVPTFGQPNVAALLGDPNSLRINEWYAAGAGDDFIELFNPRQYPVDLSGLYLTDNPVYGPDKTRLGPLSFVGPSGFVVFHADGRNKPGHVDFALASDVGFLSLLDEDLRPIDTVLYYWQTANISEGLSPDGGQGREFFATPTPGRVNRETVVINEVLSHAHALDPDWIELYNTTDESINVGGWFLSDSENDLQKYEIPAGTVLDAGAYVVFYENQHFGKAAAPGCHTPFALSENGDTVYLSSGRDGRLTQYRIEEEFGAAESNVAFGRYCKSDGTYNFVAMSDNTPEGPNADPKVGPVVISEIMYHPAGNPDAEYVELVNITAQPVTLFDPLAGQAWTFEDEGGITFAFPSPPVTMAAGERILLVKDVAAFGALFSAPPATRIFAWGASGGSLDNAGEKLQLNKPGDADTPVAERNSIRVDRVNYSDGSHPLGQDPWPTAADGYGQSLHRIVASEYGNDVINWQAAEPNPGL